MILWLDKIDVILDLVLLLFTVGASTIFTNYKIDRLALVY